MPLRIGTGDTNASVPFWNYIPIGEVRQRGHAEATARPTPTPKPKQFIGGEFGKTLFNPNNPSIVYNLEPVGKRHQELHTFIQRFDGSTWTSIANGFVTSDFPFSIEIASDAAAWRALEFDPSTSEGLLYGAVRVYAWTQSSNTFTPHQLRPCQREERYNIVYFGNWDRAIQSELGLCRHI